MKWGLVLGALGAFLVAILARFGRRKGKVREVRKQTQAKIEAIHRQKEAERENAMETADMGAARGALGRLRNRPPRPPRR